MRVLLCKPPFARLLASDVYRVYPIGLMYVAAMLRERGHEVLVYHDDVSNSEPIARVPVALRPLRLPECTDAELAPLDKVLDDFKPDVVGISACTADFPSALAVAKRVKARGLRVVAGGIHPSLLPNDVIRDFDAVVVGEGEHEAAARAFESSESGLVIECPHIDDLDVRLPARDAVIGGENYTTFLQGMIQTQRGCPYNCGFCATPQVFGRKVRRRDPALVRAEVEHFGMHDGRVIDDSFGVHREHGLAVCRELGKTNYRWVCDVALQDIDDERIEAWLSGGCYRINVGIESASPRWQELAGKRVAHGRPEEVCRNVVNRGLGIVFYFMLGFPGETYDEMMQTIAYGRRLKELGAALCISIVTPYPKTKLWDLAQERLHKKGVDWSNFIHQSEDMGFGDCTPEQWHSILAEANEIG